MTRSRDKWQGGMRASILALKPTFNTHNQTYSSTTPHPHHRVFPRLKYIPMLPQPLRARLGLGLLRRGRRAPTIKDRSLREPNLKQTLKPTFKTDSEQTQSKTKSRSVSQPPPPPSKLNISVAGLGMPPGVPAGPGGGHASLPN